MEGMFLCLKFSILALFAINISLCASEYSDYVLVFDQNENTKQGEISKDENLNIKANDKELHESALKDALYYISGVIYGYTYEYKPPFKPLNIKEYFNIVPRVILSAKDIEIYLKEQWKDSNKIYFRFGFKLNEKQDAAYKVWSASNFKEIKSEGQAALAKDPQGKDAFLNGVKECVLKYLKTKLAYRPSRAEGYLSLLSFPKIFLRGQDIFASVLIKINTNRIDGYIY